MDPIAIIGMGCRFPGAQNPAALWELLRCGRDAITEVPPQRWDVDSLYHPTPGQPGKMNTRWGCFLEEIDKFDAKFFGISPREANDMDPQQRLLLETAWEALEHGGLSPEKLSGSKTGVFIGIGSTDYCQLGLLIPDHFRRISAYTGTGNAHSIAANRLSYVLNLRGPSLAVDTACSSSLVAIHLGCQSLWSGESEAILAGGVNAILGPEVSIAFSQAHMLASDGRCKSFDARADGYVRGEGCGIVVLKLLSKALEDGDHILAVIRSSVVNQDGRSNGLTAPNGPAQQAAIRQALETAGIAPSMISYIEAHGTGTPLGDPIEMQALTATLSPGRAPGQTCLVGSVKTNIGHLETASGVAGLIKVVLALQHQEIPPHLHLQTINPYIKLENTMLAIATESRAWPTQEEPRYAGISSFGFGGTNAFIVLEESPAQTQTYNSIERPEHLLTLSAKNEDSLRELAERYKTYLQSPAQGTLADICFTANTGRAHFSHRLAVAGDSTEELGAKLGAFASGEIPQGLLTGHVQRQGMSKVAFLFTGQGAQYSMMGKQLYDTQPTFRKSLDLCAQILEPYLSQPLQSVFYSQNGNASQLNETAYTQPALFALEYALAQLWLSWGIKPDIVMGHSVGEYVAACIAGVFKLEDGLMLLAERARLMQALPQSGMMAALSACESRAVSALSPYQQSVSLAAINGPANTVISGTRESVQAIIEELQDEGVVTNPLTVSHAFHSPLMNPMLDSFASAASRVRFHAPQLPMVSNVTGRVIEPGMVPDADYWRQHISQPVRFADGIQALTEYGCGVFLELGPNPILLGLGRACQPKADSLWLPSLRQKHDDWRVLLNSLAALYIRGVKVDWEGFDHDYLRRRLQLPTYPFKRDSYWVEGIPGGSDILSSAAQSSEQHFSPHPLLGRRLRAVNPIFESVISTRLHPYLKDHCLEGAALLPASAYVEMGLAAAQTLFKDSSGMLAELEFRTGLFLSEDEGQTLQVVLSTNDFGETSFDIYSHASNGQGERESWTLHATGKIKPGSGQEAGQAEERSALDDVRARCTEEIPINDYYQEFRERGLQYGPQFQNIERIWRCDTEAIGRLKAHDALQPELALYHIHPAILDSGFQVLAAALPAEVGNSTRGSVYVPVGLERLRSYAPQTPGTELWVHARARAGQEMLPNTIEGDITFFDETGRRLLEVTGLRLQCLERKPLANDQEAGQGLYTLEWQLQKLEEAASQSAPVPATESGGLWIIFADSGGRATALKESLTRKGEHCVLVSAGAGFEQSDEQTFSINPQSREDFHTLLRAIRNKEYPPCRAIIHFWSLDTPANEELTTNSLETARTLSCTSVLHVVQELSEFAWNKTPRLYLITGGVHTVDVPAAPGSIGQAPLWGLGRVIAREHPELRCTCVDISPNRTADELTALLQELSFDGVEDQVALRGEQRRVARLVSRSTEVSTATPDESSSSTEGMLVIPKNSPFRLESVTPGILGSLRLKAEQPRRVGPGEVKIQVRATGLNFRDVMKAMGIYPSGRNDIMWLGDECAGTIVELGEGVEGLSVGDEVMALAPASFSSFVTTPASFVVPKPAHLSYEQAATIPVTFTTAYYGLCHLARLGKGERILIHAAAGGVGLAALQIAQWLGCEIFGTAGSQEKRDYLSALGVQHIFDSRSLDFADEVRQYTAGRGVDVVLNSLAGNALLKGLGVLAPYGRFVEIGKRDIYENSKVGLLPFKNNLSFFAIDMDMLFRERPEFAAILLREVMQLFADGVFNPLPLRCFPIEETVGAFRFMAQAKQIGKIVISIPESDGATQAGVQTSTLNSDCSYLITGGLGSLGLAMAQRLAERGARHLVLTGRSRPSEAVEESIAVIKATGAEVKVFQADVAEEEQVRQLLAEIDRSMPPLKGLIHAAGITDDGLLLNLEPHHFESVMRPKVNGAWNLHTLTCDRPLDFFVLFSSVASILGSPGQANYAAANAFLDALAQHRRLAGLPALSINWGPWDKIGMAARVGGRGNILHGMGKIAPDEGLSILEDLLEYDATQVTVMSVNWPRWQKLYPSFCKIPLLKELLQQEEAVRQVSQSSSMRTAFLAAPVEERRSMLQDYIQKEVSVVLQIDPSQVDIKEPLNSLGLDSLMGVELQTRIENTLGLTLPRIVLMQSPSIEQLIDQVLDMSSKDAPQDSDAVDSTAPQAIVISQPVIHGIGSRPLANLRLFCFPSAGGAIQIFRSWRDDLSTMIEVCPVEVPRSKADLKERPFTELATMVSAIAQAIRLRLDKPFAFFGHSMGALVSFELARLLRREYKLYPLHLLVSGYRAPQIPCVKTPMYTLPEPDFLERLRRMNGIPEAVLNDTELMQAFIPRLRADLKACETYQYQAEPSLDCPITALGGLEDEQLSNEDLSAWREQTTSDFSLQRFPGGHFYMNTSREPLLRLLSLELERLIDLAVPTLGT